MDFMAGMELFSKVAEVSEADGHHPDLHLEGYRYLSIPTAGVPNSCAIRVIRATKG